MLFGQNEIINKPKSHAFGSTFAFLANAQSQQKMQKSYQSNAPQPDKINEQTAKRKEGRTANKGNRCTTPHFQ